MLRICVYNISWVISHRFEQDSCHVGVHIHNVKIPKHAWTVPTKFRLHCIHCFLLVYCCVDSVAIRIYVCIKLITKQSKSENVACDIVLRYHFRIPRQNGRVTTYMVYGILQIMYDASILECITTQ